jgi:RNase H-fold protein (predicted Holliday junction resolvase)
LRILAIDPGTSKCGIAVADQHGTILRGVVGVDAIGEFARGLMARYGPEVIVIGNRTGAREIAQLVGNGLPIEFVDEHRSSEEARRRYWRYNKPTGWRRLLPTSLQVPPEPYDDIVAEILAERFFLHCKF